MSKVLPLFFAISLTANPVLAWGEGGCSFSGKNKTSQDQSVEQVEGLDATE